jgi:autotransporter-associated beta strand protein
MILAAVSAGPAVGDEYTWTGATDGNWSVAGNWIPDPNAAGTVPADGDDLVFADAAGVTLATTNDIPLGAVGALTIQTAGVGITSPALTLNTGVTASEDFTFAFATALGADNLWTVGAGATVVQNNVISGSSNLTKAGAGTLELGGANTYNNLLVDGGLARLMTADAVGNDLIVNAGGTAELANVILAKDVVINDGGTLMGSGNAQVALTGGDAISIDSSGTVGSPTEAILASGSQASDRLVLGQTGNDWQNLITGGAYDASEGALARLVIQGGGTVAFAKHTHRTRAAADWQLDSGFLEIGHWRNLGDGGDENENDIYFNGGGLRLVDTGDGGTSLSSGHALIVEAAGGTIDLPDVGLSINNDGQISGSGALTKTGAGDLVIAGENVDFTGGIAVQDGTLLINDPDSLGSAGTAEGTIALQGGHLWMEMVGSDGATVQVGNPVSVAGDSSITPGRSNSGKSIVLEMGDLAVEAGGATLTVLQDPDNMWAESGELVFGQATLDGDLTLQLDNIRPPEVFGGYQGSTSIAGFDDGGAARTIAKAGLGRLLITDASSLVAGSSVHLMEGELALNVAGAIGSASLTLDPNTTLTSGAAGALSDSATPAPITIGDQRTLKALSADGAFESTTGADIDIIVEAGGQIELQSNGPLDAGGNLIVNADTQIEFGRISSDGGGSDWVQSMNGLTMGDVSMAVGGAAGSYELAFRGPISIEGMAEIHTFAQPGTAKFNDVILAGPVTATDPNNVLAYASDTPETGNLVLGTDTSGDVTAGYDGWFKLGDGGFFAFMELGTDATVQKIEFIKGDFLTGPHTLKLNGMVVDESAGGNIRSEKWQFQGAQVELSGDTTFDIGVDDTEIDFDGRFDIGGDVSGSGKLTKTGNANMRIEEVSDWTGGFEILAGVIELVEIGDNFAANGAIELGIEPDNDVGLFVGGTQGTADELANDLVVRAGTGDRLFGMTAPGYGSDWQLNATGDVALEKELNVDVNQADGTLTMSGVISGAGGLTKRAGGTLRLTGASTYTGETLAFDGTLIVAGDAPAGADGALGNALTPVYVGDGVGDPNDPNSGQVAALLTEGAVEVGRDVTIQPQANPQYVRVVGGSTADASVFSGAVTMLGNVQLTAVDGGIVAVIGDVDNTAGMALVKTGAGTVEVTGSISGTASAIEVQEGTLVINQPASTIVTEALSVTDPNAALDITSDKLVVDYSDTGISPLLDVQAYAAADQLVSCLVDGSIQLVVVDNVGAQEVLARATYGGDANLDGVVDVGDLGILAGNWQSTNTTWLTADFTGDGLVDVGDLGVLAGGWSSVVPDDCIAAVPEPASLALVTCAGLALIRRRRS